MLLLSDRVCFYCVSVFASFLSLVRENLLARQTLEQNLVQTGATDLDVAMFHRDGGKCTFMWFNLNTHFTHNRNTLSWSKPFFSLWISENITSIHIHPFRTVLWCSSSRSSLIIYFFCTSRRGLGLGLWPLHGRRAQPLHPFLGERRQRAPPWAHPKTIQTLQSQRAAAHRTRQQWHQRYTNDLFLCFMYTVD